MLWLILSLSTALAVSTHDAWIKKWFSDLPPAVMAAYPLIYGLPLFAFGIWFVPVPQLDRIFWICLIGSFPLNAVSFVLYIRAIQISPLSLTIPYLAFTPVFMLFTSVLVLNEYPNSWGIGGILIICLGSYLLQIEKSTAGLLAPFKAVLTETGSRLMLIVSFLFSLAAVVGKQGIMHSSPMFFTMAFFCLFCVGVTGILLSTGFLSPRHFRRSGIVPGMVAGGLFFAHVVLHGFAIALTKAAYMIAVKRLSILFSVVYGGLVFREHRIYQRMLGAACMVAGAVLIVLKGN